MRTKPCEGVLRLEIERLDPRPELYLVYDGLAGIDRRSMLQDVVEGLGRKGPEELGRFVEAMRKRGAGYIDVCFSDYVSYGVGGGDATAEFHFRRMMVLYYPRTATTSEYLVLHRVLPPVPADAPPLRVNPVDRVALSSVEPSRRRQ